LNGFQRLCGVSPFMPMAAIHSSLPMRRTMTVSPRLYPRADVTVKLRAPTGMDSSTMTCFVSSVVVTPDAPAMCTSDD
jgi:hypothetical protein